MRKIIIEGEENSKDWAIKELDNMLEQAVQDKFNFAIAELDKVKNYFCEEELDGDEMPTGDWIYTKDAVEIALYIDNQIKVLKELQQNESAND